MKSFHTGRRVFPVLLMAWAALARPAAADVSLFPQENIAANHCGADEVVWINLDRGRYYHKAQADYAKGNNGGYACLKQAAGKYHPGQSQ